MAPDRPARAWLVAAALLAAQVFPLTRGPLYDSFPWSTFPMFAHGLPTAVTPVDQLLAVAADGSARPVPPRLVANDEVLQAAATLRTTIRRGKKASRALCRKVAARVAADPEWSDIVRLELVSRKFDALRYFAGDQTPLGKPRVRAKCKVPRK
jgi:hypothetical protein